MAIAMVASFLVLLLALPTVFGTKYSVGDTSGRSPGVDYSTWVYGKTFKVGDCLVFNYSLNHHVDLVNENDYKSCSSSNDLKSFYDGNMKVELTKPGYMYFICPTPGHCGAGMKLGIKVVDASTSLSNPSFPSTRPNGEISFSMVSTF